MLRTSTDVIILNEYGTTADVINFHMGSLALKHTQLTSYAVRAPLNPPITAMHATGQHERLSNTYIRGGRYALWATLFFTAPLIVFRRELFKLYIGSEYMSAATIMALLLLLYPIVYGNVMMPHLAHAKATMRPWAIRSAIINITRLLLSIYMVGFAGLGAIGAALASVIVMLIFEPLLNWPFGLKLAGVKFLTWFKQTLMPGLLPGIIIAPVWIGLNYFIKPSTWFELGACAGGGLLCYVVLILIFFLTSYERDIIKEFYSRIRSFFNKKAVKA
jgi:O-antigen/teichoic acid export membrane protein